MASERTSFHKEALSEPRSDGPPDAAALSVLSSLPVFAASHQLTRQPSAPSTTQTQRVSASSAELWGWMLLFVQPAAQK